MSFLKKIALIAVIIMSAPTIIAQNPGDTVNCTFNTPRSNPMPIMNYRSYNDDPTFTGSITVIGENGPDLSPYRKLDIAYTNGLLATFFFQTWGTFQQVNLIPNTSHTFDQAQPELTLSNTGIPNFDGSYYVNIIDNGLRIDLHDFVMVSKTGDFSIYFSNLDAAPDCVEDFVYDERIDGELSSDNNGPTVLQFSPGGNRVYSTQSMDQPNFFSFQIPEGYQLSKIVVASYEGSDDLGFIGIDEGSSISTRPASFIGGLSYGTANVGTDILAAMGDASNPAAVAINGFGFTPPLTAPRYTVWLNQTGVNSSAVLNFVVTSDDDNLSVTTSEIDNEPLLTQNYPNPFKNTTTIAYRLGKKSMVTLDIYNIQGQRVKSLDTGLQGSGSHKVTFDLDHMNTGIYIAVLATDQGSQKQLIVLEN